MDFDRDLEDVESLQLYHFRKSMFSRIARIQVVVVALPFAEDRIEDALEVVINSCNGISLWEDNVLVGNLTGIAIASMVLDDCIALAEHHECPNLYWAYATLPKPLVTYEKSLGFERKFMLEEIKQLKEVDLQPRDEMFWNKLIEKLANTFVVTQIGDWGSLDLDAAKAKLQGMIDQSKPRPKSISPSLQALVSNNSSR